MPPRTDADLPDDDVPAPRDPDAFVMRAPCPRCRGGGVETTDGYIESRGQQRVVRCRRCDSYQYCAPRRETGEPQRSTRSRPQIKPSQRGRILERDGYACVLCGRSPIRDGITLHIGHLVSVEDAPELGVSEADLWHDSNLVAMCEEDNLGLGRRSVPARLVAALVIAGAKRERDAHTEAS